MKTLKNIFYFYVFNWDNICTLQCIHLKCVGQWISKKVNNEPRYRSFSSSQKICAYLFPLFIIYSIYVFYLSIYSILFISIFFQRQPLFWFVVLSILELHLRRIIQYVLFCVCFLLLNLASVTFTHVTVTISTSLLFIFFSTIILE